MDAFDVHNHIIETKDSLSLIPKLQTQNMLLMTTQRDQWSEIVRFECESKIIAFGIHPWFAHKHDEHDLQKLQNLLESHPMAAVGEIGLDSIATDPQSGSKYEMDKQIYFFKRQMQLAARFQRPVSIHSVQTHGKMLDYFKTIDRDFKNFNGSNCPPAIMLHSFSGSTEILNALLKLPRIGNRFWFSVSYFVNSRSLKSQGRIAAIPDDRLLLESDLHDCAQIDEAIRKAAEMISNAKGN